MKTVLPPLKATLSANLAVLCGLAFTCLLPSIAPHQARASYSTAVQQRIHQVEHNLYSWAKVQGRPNWSVAERMAYHKVMGMSLAVIHNYQIEWVKAYDWADKADQRHATPATLFQAASIGKSLHAMGCLKLAQDKKVDLHQDINRYLTSWKFPYDNISPGQKITLAHILSHTAGLSVHGYDGYKVGTALPTLMQILKGEKPANSPAVHSEFEPDLKFQYSGGGYEVSELLVEDVTKLPYQSYMNREVLKPLKMHNSTYDLIPSGKFKTRLATAYRADGKEIGCRFHLYPEKACGAGLWSTAEDIARFVIETQLALLGRSNKVLSPQMTNLMVSAYKPGFNSGYGVFLEKKGQDWYFQHSGLNEGFRSQYYGSLKNGNGVVVLVNSDDGRFSQEVVNSVADVYRWKDFAPYELKTVVELPEETLRSYVGKYQFKGGLDDYVALTLKNGALYLQESHNDTGWKVYFTSPTECFMDEAKWVTQVFSKDKEGKVDGFDIVAGDSKQRATKVN